MTYTLSQIAEKIGIDFDGKDIQINAIQTLKEATATNLSFLSDSKYTKDLSSTKAGAVLVTQKDAQLLPSGTTALIVDNPYLKLALASKLFAHDLSVETNVPIIGKDCQIAIDARFGKNVTLGDGVVVMSGCYVGENTTIGEKTILHANATIYHGCIIGSHCILHSGSVIGSDGFGFATDELGNHFKIYQNGNVVMGDEVEVGANTTVDRAVFGSTYISDAVKLDNLVQVGHNCNLGSGTIMAGQSGIAGSSKTGRNVVLGGQSATAGHLEIGDFAMVAGKSGVMKSLEGGKTYGGFPAIEQRLWLKQQAKISALTKRKKRS